MSEKEVLAIVLREMTAIGRGWRHSWSDFDGRTLRSQLNDIETWAALALKGDAIASDYTGGTDFEKDQIAS